METLKEVVIDLLLKNKELEKEVKSQKDSLAYWYQRNDDLTKELDKLKSKQENEII